MLDSTMASSDSLKVSKKYLPKSHNVFQEMIKTINRS